MERSEKKNINGKAHRVQGAGSVDVLPSGKHRVRVVVPRDNVFLPSHA